MHLNKYMFFRLFAVAWFDSSYHPGGCCNLMLVVQSGSLNKGFCLWCEIRLNICLKQCVGWISLLHSTLSYSYHQKSLQQCKSDNSHQNQTKVCKNLPKLKFQHSKFLFKQIKMRCSVFVASTVLALMTSEECQRVRRRGERRRRKKRTEGGLSVCLQTSCARTLLLQGSLEHSSLLTA